MGGAPRPPAIRGYGLGGVDNLLSAEAVERAGAELVANALMAISPRRPTWWPILETRPRSRRYSIGQVRSKRGRLPT
jgi:hypothetical protein